MTKKVGWFKQPEKHREAYYKGRQERFKARTPIPTRLVRLIGGEIVRAGQRTTPRTVTAPLPDVILLRLTEFIQPGDTGDLTVRKQATARKIAELYSQYSEPGEINIPPEGDILSPQGARYYIATKLDRTTVVGAIGVSAGSGHLHQLVTSVRGHGYGKAIYYRLEDIMRREGRASLFGDVRITNQKAQHFWESVGFIKESQGERSYRYTKRLTTTEPSRITPFRVETVV